MAKKYNLAIIFTETFYNVSNNHIAVKIADRNEPKLDWVFACKHNITICCTIICEHTNLTNK